MTRRRPACRRHERLVGIAGWRGSWRRRRGWRRAGRRRCRIRLRGGRRSRWRHGRWCRLGSWSWSRRRRSSRRSRRGLRLRRRTRGRHGAVATQLRSRGTSGQRSCRPGRLRRRRLVGPGLLLGRLARLTILARLGIALGGFLLGSFLLCLLAALRLDQRPDPRQSGLVGCGNSLLVRSAAIARGQRVRTLDLAIRARPRLLAGCRGAAEPAAAGQQRQSGDAEQAAQNATAADPVHVSPHRRHSLPSPLNPTRASV